MRSPGERPNDYDRSRVARILRANADEQRLSTRELEERLEHAYRAKTLSELDAVIADLDGTKRLDAGVVMAMGLPVSPARKRASFLQRQIMLTGAFLLFWIVLWAVTGAGTEWLVLIVVSSATGLTFRLARGDRAKSRRGRIV